MATIGFIAPRHEVDVGDLCNLLCPKISVSLFAFQFIRLKYPTLRINDNILTLLQLHCQLKIRNHELDGNNVFDSLNVLMGPWTLQAN